ncbi:DarT ssDNA thymidine ADP-ribosyltransferase family protein [Photobacterium leiognathi]|uniref:DarT ssDNA thymidine ADP-ribosyltransferase family protein n=1 Tax=Photobacterium leiognathi TaxID=553611 RepID=UPI0027384327|nr:DarT ssDNA thymidine ADP-ribosyltransferase family protein [Photobacterium leiognathi]
MADIQNQKLLYHITSIHNLASILKTGLMPRAQLHNFIDVADHEILGGRAAHGLEHYVPFHFFAKNPFDGKVQKDNPLIDFVLISVHRNTASENGWRVIPRHPLANQKLELLEYAEGMKSIDWEMMNLRDYHNAESKSVCMAECLSPYTVTSDSFYSLFVSNDRVKQQVDKILKESNIEIEVIVNQSMFTR